MLHGMHGTVAEMFFVSIKFSTCIAGMRLNHIFRFFMNDDVVHLKIPARD